MDDFAINWNRLLPGIIMIIGFLVAVFLLLRELWLWYFRINDLNRKLDKSNEHLEAIRAAIETQAGTGKIPPMGNVDRPPAAKPREWPDRRIVRARRELGKG